MEKRTGIETKRLVGTPPSISRLRRALAAIFFLTGPTLGALPVARFGIDDSLLVMLIVFFSILIFVVGLRNYATTLLGVNTTVDEPPDWLGPVKSLLVVTIFLASLLGVAAAISWISVSDQIRVMLLFGAAGVLWELMRRLGRGVLAVKPAVPNGGDSTMMEGRY